MTSPAHVSGTVDITVTTSGGMNTTGSADQFTYTGPVVTSLTPAAGPIMGGATIKIRGTGLAGPTAVKFGDTTATIIKANKPGTLITATVPAGTSAWSP